MFDTLPPARQSSNAENVKRFHVKSLLNVVV